MANWNPTLASDKPDTDEALNQMRHCEDLLMHHLRMKAGLVVGYWTVCAAVADVMLGHWDKVPVPWKVRATKRIEVCKSLKRLIYSGKVIRYCHRKFARKAGVRINEAFVKNQRQASPPVSLPGDESIGPDPDLSPMA